MERGTIRFSGPTADLLNRPDLLRSVFLTDIAAPAGNRARHRPVVRLPSRGDTSALEVAGLGRSFGGNQAVIDVSFSVGQGRDRRDDRTERRRQDDAVRSHQRLRLC